MWLQDGRQSERQGSAMEEPYPEHSLRIVDTAYLSYADMRAASQSQRFWITGTKADMLFADRQGRMWNLTEWLRSLPESEQVVDVWVRAGKQEQVPVRLIALRLPKEVIQRRKQRANHDGQRSPKSKGSQQCGRRSKPGARSQPHRQARKHHRVSASKQNQLEWCLVLTNVDGSVLNTQQVVALMRKRPANRVALEALETGRQA